MESLSFLLDIYWIVEKKKLFLSEGNLLEVLKGKMQKETGVKRKVDRDGIEMVMTTKEYLGDACGNAATNCLSQVAGQLTYFYTSKVGMAASTASFVQMLATLCDGVSDIIMGRIVDKTNTKDGKCRPWLKWMIIPLILGIVLLTTVPKGSPIVQSIYATLSLIFSRAIVYTAIMIPYYSMITYMTRSMEERGKIGNYRAIFGNAVGVVFGIICIPVTNALGGTQRSWIVFSAVVGIIASMLLYIAYRSAHERYRDNTTAGTQSEESKISVLESLNILFHNRYWILMLIAQFALFVVFVLQMGSLPFYCMYIQGNDNLVAIVNLIAISGIVSSFLATPFLIRRFGLRTTGIIGGIAGEIGTVMRMLAPTDFTIFVIGFSLVLFATGTINAVMSPMIINTSEYNDYKYGYKLAGLTNSASSFGGKVGAAIGQVVLGAVLAAGGYNAALTKQPETALKAICHCSIDLIGVALLVILICFIAYTFDKEYPRMLRANIERRAAK